MSCRVAQWSSVPVKDFSLCLYVMTKGSLLFFVLPDSCFCVRPMIFSNCFLISESLEPLWMRFSFSLLRCSSE